MKYPKTVLPPPPPPPGPLEISDDFEKYEPGAAPDNVVISGERNGASIRVTDQEAASGKRCLKVTDAKDLQPSYEPHFFYQPHLVDGTVRESFDLKLEPGALMFTEWRDEKEYPDCIGPSVTFDGSGRIMAYGKLLATVPTGRWVHVQIEAALGKIASRKYSLRVVTRGGSPQLFADLPIPGKEFRELHWLGFVTRRPLTPRSTSTTSRSDATSGRRVRRLSRNAKPPRRERQSSCGCGPTHAPVGKKTHGAVENKTARCESQVGVGAVVLE